MNKFKKNITTTIIKLKKYIIDDISLLYFIGPLLLIYNFFKKRQLYLIY